MIIRIYKKYYLKLPESEMTVLDGMLDGLISMVVILAILTSVP